MREILDKIQYNQEEYIKQFYNSYRGKIAFVLSKKVRINRRKFFSYLLKCNNKNNILSDIIEDIYTSKIDRMCEKYYEKLIDFKLALRYSSKRKILTKDNKTHYVSVVTIVKDVSEYIEEWIEFHLYQGIQHFYIFDNESTDDLIKRIRPYIKKGIVTLIYWPGKGVQLSAYRYAIKKFGKVNKWMAIIDSDEFLFCLGQKINEFLESAEAYPGIGVNWIVFGPCGHKIKPKGNVIENYQLTFKDRNNDMNLHIKSIVQCNMVESIPSPHFCRYKNGKKAVDENFNEITGTRMNVVGKGWAFTQFNSTNKIRINHYWTKSLEELREKCDRGFPDGNKNLEYNKSLEKLNVPLCKDRVILDCWTNHSI